MATLALPLRFPCYTTALTLFIVAALNVALVSFLVPNKSLDNLSESLDNLSETLDNLSKSLDYLS